MWVYALSYLPIHTDEDYAIAMNLFNVTFGVGSGDGTVETAMISAVEDTAVEGDHEFTVSIQSTSPPALLGVSSEMATIMDDDCKFTVNYKVGELEVCCIQLFNLIPFATVIIHACRLS